MVDTPTTISSLWGSFNPTGYITELLGYLMYLLIFLLVIGIIWYFYREKTTFKYQVRIFKQRRNGLVKEFNTKGGYMKDKNGVNSFYVKLTRNPFKLQKMDDIPNPDMMDEEDRVYYFQASPDCFIQTKREIIYEDMYVENQNYKEPTEQERTEYINKFKEDIKDSGLSEEEQTELALQEFEKEQSNKRGQYVNYGKLIYKPVPSDTKSAIINDLISVKNALKIDAGKMMLYTIGGIIAVCIVGAVVFYIATNKGHLPIVEYILPLIN